ncbi:MAG: TRAP transporter large permease subunit [Candidatus Electrothrix sp. ATG1]|nr:TRAP transporter large permease subunit [Candidatus Electrothrix sp. ATG1]
MNFNAKTINYLKGSTLFSLCSNTDLARIAPFITEVPVSMGETLFNTGDQAENLFLLMEGQFEVQSGRRVLNRVEGGTLGEESVKNKGKYLTTAVALNDSKILKIPQKQILRLLKKYPEMKDKLYSSLVNHHAHIKIEDRATKEIKKEDAENITVIGWLFAILLPAVIYYYGGTLSFDWKTKIFLTVACATVIMWIFRLVDEFIPSIMAVIVILVLDIAPPEVVLSGFTSGSFFMALSIFGLSAILTTSGLTYRIVINLFRFLPLSQFWHSLAIFITGIFLTPLFPSANGRIGIATPILLDMVESLGYKKGGKASTRLAIATFSGFTMFSSIFLSSKSMHFIVFGILPLQVRDRFNWGYWFYAAIVAGLVLMIFYFLLTQIMFRNSDKPRLSRDIIKAQYDVLGPLNAQEWAAISGIALFALGIATSSIHKIQLPWIGFAVLYFILVLGFLPKKDFKTHVDWTFLLYLGALIGLIKTISYLGLDISIGQNFLWLGSYMKNNFYLFVPLLSISTMLLRLFIPNTATVAILASVLFPISLLNGINPWVIGFIILIMSDSWMLPYQCSYYLLFDELTSPKRLFSKSMILKFNFISITFRIAAVYASIPFWKSVGIL